MASRGQQKAIVRRESLPAPSVLNDGTYGYVVRYRVISEDQNRFSSWSPIHIVRPQYVFIRPDDKAIGDFVIERNTGYVNVIWDQIQVYDQNNEYVINVANQYDVWVKWGTAGSGVWKYVDRVSGNSLTLSIPEQYNDTESSVVQDFPEEVSIEIHMPGSPVQRDIDNLLVYQQTKSL